MKAYFYASMIPNFHIFHQLPFGHDNTCSLMSSYADFNIASSYIPWLMRTYPLVVIWLLVASLHSLRVDLYDRPRSI